MERSQRKKGKSTSDTDDKQGESLNAFSMNLACDSTLRVSRLWVQHGNKVESATRTSLGLSAQTPPPRSTWIRIFIQNRHRGRGHIGSAFMTQNLESWKNPSKLKHREEEKGHKVYQMCSTAHSIKKELF